LKGEALIAAFKTRCYVNVPELKKLTADFKCAEIDKAIAMYFKLLAKQEVVMNTVAKCQKPFYNKFMIDEAEGFKKDLIPMQISAKAYATHLRVIEDSF